MRIERGAIGAPDRSGTLDPGFEAHNVLTMNLSLSTAKYALPGLQIAFFDDVLRRVRSTGCSQRGRLRGAAAELSTCDASASRGPVESAARSAAVRGHRGQQPILV